MSDASLSARLPRGDANGIGPIVKELISEPETVHALIVLVDCKKITTDVDSGETVPIMRIRRIEAIRPADIKDAQRLIRRSWEDRNGGTVLPMEMEEDLTALFKNLNIQADEVLGFDPKPEKTSDGPDFSDGEDGSS